jgi:hypothetical protein
MARNNSLMRDRVAGAAVGALATWAVAKATGALYTPSAARGKGMRLARNLFTAKRRTNLGAGLPLVVAIASGAMYGARRTVDAVRSGRGLPLALLVALGATAATALGRA